MLARCVGIVPVEGYTQRGDSLVLMGLAVLEDMGTLLWALRCRRGNFRGALRRGGSVSENFKLPQRWKYELSTLPSLRFLALADRVVCSS